MLFITHSKNIDMYTEKVKSTSPILASLPKSNHCLQIGGAFPDLLYYTYTCMHASVHV